MELLLVITDDAASLLTPMLKGMKAEGCDGCGVAMAANAKYAAFFVKAVIVDIYCGGAFVQS